MPRRRFHSRPHSAPKRPLVWINAVADSKAGQSFSLTHTAPGATGSPHASFINAQCQAQRPMTLVAVKGLCMVEGTSALVLPAVGVANPGDAVTGSEALTGVPHFMQGTGPNHFPAVGRFVGPYSYGASPDNARYNGFVFDSKGMRKMDIGDLVYASLSGQVSSSVSFSFLLSLLFKL